MNTLLILYWTIMSLAVVIIAINERPRGLKDWLQFSLLFVFSGVALPAIAISEMVKEW